MLAKKQFIKIINHIVEEEDRQEKFDQALKEYAPSDFTGFSNPNHTVFLVELLEELMGDVPEKKYGTTYISWWLWDCPNRGKCEKDSSCTVWFGDADDPDTDKIVVRTPEDLYNLLLIQYGKSPSKKSIQMAVTAQDNGVKFTLKTIDDILETNIKTKNKGWEDRKTLMEYLIGKISNEYLLTRGTGADLNYQDNSTIISVLDEES